MLKLGKSKKIFQLALLILAAGSIYPLVYLRQNFESTILSVFHLSNAELAGLYSMLGIIFVIGYIPSGWLADKVPVRYLIVFSLVLTAVTGLYYAQVPDKSALVYVYLVWGFATVFTFWSAILKTVSLLADKNEEGKYFGALDGGRGLVEAILASCAIGLFALVAGNGTTDITHTKAGFQAVVYMYCAVLIVIAVLIFFVLSDGHEKTTKSQAGPVESTFAAVRRILKIREVWVMSVVLFCGYTLFWGHYYFSGFLNVNHAVSPVNAGIVTVIVLWMRPIGGFGGGFLADKLGKSRVLAVSMVLAAVGFVSLSLLPSGSTALAYVLVVVVGLFLYAIRGIYWSLLDDCRVPAAATGIAIGIISFVGYLPDIVIPQISGAIYSAFGDDVAGANNLFFIVTAGIGLIGAAAAAYFAVLMRKRRDSEAVSVMEASRSAI